MSNYDEKFYRGRFHDLPNRPLNSIRVFISSTFSDTTEERNGLIEHVYPRLRDYCSRKYQIPFQYSDMRWGIPSTASNSHSTVEMCLQELDTCCRLSLATNCVIFLSHRYGSRLAPSTLSTDLFRTLMKFGNLTADEKDFVSDAYLYDENFLDGKYFLRNVDDETQWTSTEKKLKEILRNAADVCYQQSKITEEEHRNFFISVTAQEIYRTLKNNRDKPRRIICFFRDLIDINELDSKYRDESHSLLSEIQTHLKNSIDSEDFYVYRVRWKDDVDRENYLSKFFDDFFSALQKQIDFHLENRQIETSTNFSNQILEHAIQSNSLVQRYFPRDDILEQVKDYLFSSTNGPCVLFGESGTGKSSIMAKLVREIPKWFDSSDSISVIIRFLGATPSTSDIRRPLVSIIEQLCHIYRWAMPTKIDNLKETFEEHLINIPPHENLVILLDSIDQLQINDIVDLSIWLPTNLSFSNVKIIFSTIGTIEIGHVTYRIEEQFQTIYGQSLTEIEINAFDRRLAEQVIHSWLKQDRRCLTQDQYQWLSQKLTSQWITPLFLSLLYDQTLTWHSYDERIDKKFQEIKRTSDAIGYFYHRLGEKHGQILVQRAMRYIQISGGLNELELEDLLSSDDEVLQSIFVHYLPPWKLFRLPSTLWIRIRNDMQKYFVEKQIDQLPCISFYHRSFQYYQSMNVREIILLNEQTVRMEKVRLEYFSNQHLQTFDLSYSPKLMKKYQLNDSIISVDRCLTKQKAFQDKSTNKFNLRRLNQLTLNLNRYDFAHPWTIFHFPFLNAFLQNTSNPMSSLLYEFSIGAHDPNGELRYLLKQFERSMKIVDFYPENFAFEMIYRLYPWRNELPKLTLNLLKNCLKRCPLVLMTRSERDECLTKYSCEKIDALDIDGLRIYLLNNGNELNVFSWFYYGFFRTGHFLLKNFVTNLIDFRCRFPHVCCRSSNGSWTLINCETKNVLIEISADRFIDFYGEDFLLFVSSTKNALELWNLTSKMKISIYEFVNDQIESCDFYSSILRVKCRTNETISSLKLNEKNQFELIRTNDEKLVEHSHRFCLDDQRDFFYSFEKSAASIVVSTEKISIQSIEFFSKARRIFHLKQSRSIIWLTSTSLTIVFPVKIVDCYRTFEILRFDSSESIDYDLVHDDYHSDEFKGQSNFFVCIDRSKSIVDIFQWNFDENETNFQHRQVTHLKVDHSIQHLVFNARWFDGITIFCTDENNLYKYNGTLATFSNRTESIVTSSISEKVKIENNRFLVDQNPLKIFVLNDDNALEMKFEEESIVDYVIRKDSSEILFLDRQNRLTIFSLHSSKLRWRNEQFQTEQICLFSSSTSFYFLSVSTRSFYQIHSSKFEISLLLQVPFDCFDVCLTTKDRIDFVSSDHQKLLQFQLVDQTIVTSEIRLESLERICSIGENLIFQTKTRRIYFWSNEKKKNVRLEKADAMIFQDERLVFECRELKSLILYDFQTKLRGTIELDVETIPIQSMCLSDQKENHEQYLFVFGHDRFLRIFSVENGNQLNRVFVHEQFQSLLGIIENQLILRVNNHLTVLKILDELPKERERIVTNHSILFGRSMWMSCYDELSAWK